MKCSQCGNTEFYKKEFIDVIKSFRDTKDFDKTGITKERYNESDKDITASIVSYKIEGDAYLSINSYCDCYICKNCGHIELFAKKEFLDEIENQEKIDQVIKGKLEEKEVVYKAKYDKLFEFAEKLRKEVNELNEIIANENSTMKAYNEAKYKLPVREQYLKACDNWLKDRDKDKEYNSKRVDYFIFEYNKKIDS